MQAGDLPLVDGEMTRLLFFRRGTGVFTTWPEETSSSIGNIFRGICNKSFAGLLLLEFSLRCTQHFQRQQLLFFLFRFVSAVQLLLFPSF